MTTNPDYDILPLDRVPVEQIVAVLDQSLGSEHSTGWFGWKHVENPFGPSLGWVAVRNETILGVRIFMRWTLQYHGRHLRAIRPVDTATAPEARRLGIFQSLTQHGIKCLTDDDTVNLIFNTPNPNSRPGYEKMGWTVLPPLRHGYRLLFAYRPPQIIYDASALEAISSDRNGPERISTLVSPEYLRWRYLQAPAQPYRCARLANADGCTGIIYRVVENRLARILLIFELVGTSRERKQLACAVAQQERARVALTATGAGSLDLLGGPGFRRGESVLAVRPMSQAEPSVTVLDRWALTLGDLERII